MRKIAAARAPMLVFLVVSACVSRTEWWGPQDRDILSDPSPFEPASGSGISNNAGLSLDPSLALDSLGRPVVAWSDDSSGNFEIYVKRFDGVAWQEFGVGSATGGGISGNTGTSRAPKLVLDSADFPVVVWQDTTPHDLTYGSGFCELYVKRFDGALWQEVGSGSASGAGISGAVLNGGLFFPAIALDAADNPYVAWADGFVGVARFDGSTWGSLVAPATQQAYYRARSSSLVLDAADNPIVAWVDGPADRMSSGVYVQRYAGGSWQDLGVGSASGTGIFATSTPPSTTFASMVGGSSPVVVRQADDALEIRRFDGTEWRELYSGSPPGALSLPGAVTLDSSHDPVIAWFTPAHTDGADAGMPTGDILVRRYDGERWLDIAGLSGSEGGVSNNPGISFTPTLALDPQGVPVVAWADSTSSISTSFNFEIYVRRLDSTEWQGSP